MVRKATMECAYLLPVTAGGHFSRWGATSNNFTIHPGMIYPSITKVKVLRLETF